MDADDRKRLRDAAVACIAATNRVREAEEKGEPAPYKESFRARAMFQEVLDGPVESAAWVVQMLDALDAAEARAERAEAEWDGVGVCDACDNLSEDLLDSEGQEQCSACRQLAAMTAERDRLREALQKVEWQRDRLLAALEDVESNATSDNLCVMCDCDVNEHAADCIIGRALGRPECREVGDA